LGWSDSSSLDEEAESLLLLKFRGGKSSDSLKLRGLYFLVCFSAAAALEVAADLNKTID
jgi:hypothetical protein